MFKIHVFSYTFDCGVQSVNFVPCQLISVGWTPVPADRIPDAGRSDQKGKHFWLILFFVWSLLRVYRMNEH